MQTYSHRHNIKKVLYHKRDHNDATHSGKDTVILKRPGTNRPRYDLHRCHRVSEVFSRRLLHPRKRRSRNNSTSTRVPYLSFFPYINKLCVFSYLLFYCNRSIICRPIRYQFYAMCTFPRKFQRQLLRR